MYTTFNLIMHAFYFWVSFAHCGMTVDTRNEHDATHIAASATKMVITIIVMMS